MPLVPLTKMKEAVDLCLTGLPPKSILTVCKLFPFYLGTNLTEKRKERGEKRSQTCVGRRRRYRGEARFVDLAKTTPSFPVSSKEACRLLMEPHIVLWRLNISKIHLSRVVAVFLVFCLHTESFYSSRQSLPPLCNKSFTSSETQRLFLQFPLSG